MDSEDMGLNQQTRQLTDEPQHYLTAEQLASLLQVSVKSVSRWASSDPSMPVLRIGRTVRFPRERLMRWLKAREQGPGRSKQLHNQVLPEGERIDKQRVSIVEAEGCARS
jgi:excisionase family DNA binding protein